MTGTLQSQTIAAINNLIFAANQLTAAKRLIDQVTTTYSQLTMGSVVTALATSPVNPDGSLGTADGSPNATHVIDPRIYASTSPPLSRAISSGDVASLLTGLQGVSTFLSGAAAAQQGQLPQLLAKVSNEN